MRGPEGVGDPMSAAACGREREETPGGAGALTRRPAQHSAGRCGFKPDFKQNLNSNVSNQFQTISNFDRLEKYFLQAQKN
jgi:hypothetical protein